MNIVYLQLGSNLGDRQDYLTKASVELKLEIGQIIKSSKIYESPAWGVSNQKKYLNQIIKIKTEYSASLILEKALKIEDKLGRVRIKKWGERVIDIDLLLFNFDIIEETNLSIPHKYMHKRKFVLVPLNELAGNYLHPIYNITINELLNKCKDSDHVNEYVI